MTGATIGVAVAQFAPAADESANLEVIATLVARAGRGREGRAVPEYSSYFVDPFDASLAEHAQDLDGPFVTALTALASEHDVHIVAGLVERADTKGHVRNTVVAVDAGASSRAIASSTCTTRSGSVSRIGWNPEPWKRPRPSSSRESASL